jgi:hypothetical protein
MDLTLGSLLVVAEYRMDSLSIALMLLMKVYIIPACLNKPVYKTVS